MAINTLNIGDMILVHGFIVLKGLNHGKHYKVISMDDYSYTFRLHNGKTLCRHYINSVEGSIKCHISGDNNGIEVCTKIRKAKPSIKQDLSYVMILQSVGNPSYGQYAPISNKLTITSKNIKGLIAKCAEYIDKYDLGGGNWPNPEILHPLNGNIGYISYNGRVWNKQGSEILGELLTQSL